MDNKQIYNVPSSYEERNRLRNRIDAFVSSRLYKPPVSMEELSEIADGILCGQALDPGIKGWIMVEANNCIWRDTVASIPYEKRILLLPQCLRHSGQCEAGIDELGLLCRKCGRCTIPDLQGKADSLGVMSLVAEGFTQVIGLIENHVVDTVIGVGCLASLEKVFPLLVDNAIPGLAIPLNRAGCKDTEVDYEYVSRMIGLRSDGIALLDYDYLKSSIREWFSPESLSGLLSPADHQASAIALDWIGGDGKRWRPYLLAATYLALTGEADVPEAVKRAAVGVECFHKASLVHDDIQDNDILRYGRQTVNTAYGVPIAINVGDILLGEGYRLLAASGKTELIRVTADAHIALCKGQGMELEWSVSPRPLTMDWVLDVFRNKTVPAFEVSLTIGLICAGDDPQLRETLHRYSHALGIAYQLQDDIADFETDEPLALRPSAILAALCEQHPDSLFVSGLLCTDDLKALLNRPENKPRLSDALYRVGEMAGQYHRMALDALRGIGNTELKRLLFRVTKRILK